MAPSSIPCRAWARSDFTSDRPMASLMIPFCRGARDAVVPDCAGIVVVAFTVSSPRGVSSFVLSRSRIAQGFPVMLGRIPPKPARTAAAASPLTSSRCSQRMPQYVIGAETVFCSFHKSRAVIGIPGSAVSQVLKVIFMQDQPVVFKTQPSGQLGIRRHFLPIDPSKDHVISFYASTIATITRLLPADIRARVEMPPGPASLLPSTEALPPQD